MANNVLVIGSGGREHALTWKLSQSSHVERVFCAPGSYAIETVGKAKNVGIDIKNFKEVVEFCKQNSVGLAVVGPEDPLANGIADVLVANRIKVFGPEKNAAKIESDKNWAKAFMDKYGVPTARWQSFTKADAAKNFIESADFDALVVKASGLAAGKGVVVAENKQQACAAVDEILTSKKFGAAGETVVVEELLIGEEVSVLAFCDGTTVKLMLPAQDHKRIFDGDQGPNTGGMGAYCPCNLVTPEDLEVIRHGVFEPMIKGFRKDNVKYVGVLYAGLMMTSSGPKVLEFNCRFGDPETEAILPLLESDLYEIMLACCEGTLEKQTIRWKQNISAVGVVMASRGYPETSSKGQVIIGVEEVTKINGNLVFHCGTALKENKLVTNGGRVLIAVALAGDLKTAAVKATRMCGVIKFDGSQYRKDIALKGITRDILRSGKLTYKASGVDITAGNSLVSKIKSVVGSVSTPRSGTVGHIGGFGGLFDLKLAGFKDPLLVSGTDGVGTKLKIAQEMGVHDTIGIDLVAMCVNDVLAHGAEPLFFLDYFACGKLDVDVAQKVVSGIALACEASGCSLIGGETAEMPDMYKSGDYDLAGFAVGAVERNILLPHTDKIIPGDVIIGLPSAGVHSNGFSMVRKVMSIANVKYTDKAPFGNGTFGEEFLTPTELYVKPVLNAIKTGNVRAFAHITGGGLVENIPRVLTNRLAVELDALEWDIPTVFGWLAALGEINEPEMLRTFNCGIGGVLIVQKGHENDVLKVLKHNAKVIGRVTQRSGADSPQVVIKNFTGQMEKVMRPFVPQLIQRNLVAKKKVGVLISGSGTNLQALIDATQDPSRNIGAEIVLVISNKADVQGLERAQRANIPTKVISHKEYPTRENFDRVMTEALRAAGVEIVCLAGFMRILSGEFVREWKGRLLNIHPSLLPLFKGTHAQRQALEAGVRVSGCTVHFVEEDIDAGAILVQETVQIDINDTEETLIERIKLEEHKAFPKALQLLATGKVKLDSDGTVVWKT